MFLGITFKLWSFLETGDQKTPNSKPHKRLIDFIVISL